MNAAFFFQKKHLLLPVLLLAVLTLTQCKTLHPYRSPNRAPTSGSTAKAPAPSTSKAPAPSSNKEARLRNDVVHYADKFEGTPYVYAGKTPKTGFDCSGFTSYVMDNFDINLSPSSSMQSQQGVRKTIDNALPGDLVFFRRSPGENVFHVALVVDSGPNMLKVIHATSSRGVIVEDLMQSTYWKPKISEVRDVIGN